MYNGWTESEAQVRARMARNAARAAAVEAAEATPAERNVCPPMSETEWWRLPAVVRYFHPWERASQPLEVETSQAMQL